MGILTGCSSASSIAKEAAGEAHEQTCVGTYDGRPRSLKCSNVPAPGGVWSAKRLAVEAPDGLCAYTFEGETRPTIADKTALEDVAVIALNCSEEQPESISLREIPQFEDPSFVGTTGCDVCGIVTPERTWVLIPPERTLLRRVELRLASGSTRAFELVGATQGRTVVHFPLPAAPEGDRWLPGVVRSN